MGFDLQNLQRNHKFFWTFLSDRAIKAEIGSKPQNG
jgi:hypothetical protein